MRRNNWEVRRINWKLRRANPWLSLAALTPTFSLMLSVALLTGPASTSLAVCGAVGSSGAGGTLSGVINTYFTNPAVSNVTAGSTSLTLGTVSGAKTSVAVNDELLIIQMQGATLNISNTRNYGSNLKTSRGATSYTAGTYEYLIATSSGSGGGTINVRGSGTGNGTLNSYSSSLSTTSAAKFSYQVIVVPQYSGATLGAALSAQPWDGASGGVLAFDVYGTLNLSGTADVSGLGFRGGGGRQLRGIGAATTATNSDFLNSSDLNTHGNKGEGVAGTPRYTYASGAGAITDNSAANGSANPLGYPGGDTAMGAPGNAGGGGTDGNVSANDDNSGGGGGGNGGIGGRGGNTYGNNLATGGYGGDVLTATISKLTAGGGGGSGTRNNGTTGSAESSGGTGGGMILIRAGTLTGSGAFNSRGGVGVTPTNDGGGGGGAGGSVLLYAGNSTAVVNVNVDGGRGTDAFPTDANNIFHGPGGGGAGGVIVTNVTATTSLNGGVNGTTTTSLNAYGATPGGSGASSAVSAAGIPGIQAGNTCTPTSSAPTITKKQQNLTQNGALTAGPITVRPNDNVHYQLTASNQSFTTATTLTFRDPLPATLNAPTSAVLTCPDGTQRSVTLSASVSVDVISTCGQNLNPGQSVTLGFNTTVK